MIPEIYRTEGPTRKEEGSGGSFFAEMDGEEAVEKMRFTAKDAEAPGAGRPNPIARTLRSRLFRQRRVKPLKGKAAYTRRPKHRGGGFLLGGDVLMEILDTKKNPFSAVRR